MNWLILILVFMMISGVGVFDADGTRIALADDVQSGKLVLNGKSKQMISEGDFLLRAVSENAKRRGNGERGGVWPIDRDLFGAFIAKVWYERARLEMETEEHSK